MRRRLARLLAAGTLAGAATLAGALPAHAGTVAPARHRPTTTAVSFAGTVALSNCSGSVVRVADAADTDKALVLTNGHCLESGMPDPGQVIVDQPSSRTFSLLTADGQGTLGTLHATSVEYSTMTDTDVTLYQLSDTYAQIKQEYGIDALALSADHPTAGTDIAVVSGYWKQQYTCAVDGFAYELHESDWVWKDSVRYTEPCHVIGGTSGSPVVDTATGTVVAINNTTNENGEQCTLNNPCEVDENGTVTVHEGTGYAEETYLLARCITGSTVNLDDPNCALPKP
ncbi:S1 family peptidase [Actinocatenispora rupis]|uniref:Serine protease n=1 Tax=Actinocatenispora rupis TaxID=519421 RepID=A0A8J3NCV4_9ACTN|nr:serine protease [Actinocatenispora rupis]GID14391.1 serine protease [Actinocatenispora rupis]